MSDSPGVQRKDLAKWNEFRAAYGLYFQELFPPVSDPSDPRFAPVEPDMVVKLAKGFADSYRHEDRQRGLVRTDPQLGLRPRLRTNSWAIQEESGEFRRFDQSCEQCD